MSDRDMACGLEGVPVQNQHGRNTFLPAYPGHAVGTGLLGIQMISTVQTEEVCPGADGTSSQLTALYFSWCPWRFASLMVLIPGVCEIWSG